MARYPAQFGCKPPGGDTKVNINSEPNNTHVMMAETDMSRCLVCLDTSPGPVSEHLASRVHDLLDVPCPVQEEHGNVHLCKECREKIEEIDKLITEFREIYHDTKTKVLEKEAPNLDEKSPSTHKSAATTHIENNIPENVTDNVLTSNVRRCDVTETHPDDDVDDDDDVMDSHNDVTDAGDVIPEEGLLKKKRTNYSCGCGEVYYGPRALEAHRREVHGGGVPCRDCGVILKDPQQLQAHSVVHKKDKFNCSVCGVGFHRALYLRNHQRLSKTCSVSVDNLTPNQRDVTVCGCGERYDTPAELKIHRQKAHRGRFVCAHCKRTFGTFGTLTRHMHFHSNDVFKCPCGESFKHPTYLQVHQRRFHKQRAAGLRQQKGVGSGLQSTEIGTRQGEEIKEQRREGRVTRGRKGVKGNEKEKEEQEKGGNEGEGRKGGEEKEEEEGKKLEVEEKGNDEGRREVRRKARERKATKVVEKEVLEPEGEGKMGRGRRVGGRKKEKGSRVEEGKGTGNRESKGEEDGEEQEIEESVYEAETEAEDMETEEGEQSETEQQDADDNLENGPPSLVFSQVPEISCVACDTTYQTKSHFDKHIHTYHWQPTEDGKRHQCVICPKSLRTIRAIVNHARQHRSQMHSCSKCDKVFAKKEHLMEHSLSTHNPNSQEEKVEDQTFQCEDCGKTEQSQSLLSAHILVEHENFGSFGAALEAPRRKPHQCSFCNMSFASRRDLQKHTAKHARALRDRSATPFECPECRKQCKTAGGLEKHVQNYCPGKDGVYDDGTGRLKRSFLCSICGAFYKTRSGYEMHLSKHTGEGQHECGECHQKFRMKSHLTKHMAGHTRPFMCAQCGKRFSSSNHLNEHQVIHSADLNFNCMICNEKFRWRLSLARHQWRCHGLGSPPKQYRKLMMCKLCNTEVSRNARVTHCQTHHKDVAYSTRHFKCLPCKNSQGKGTARAAEIGSTNNHAVGQINKMTMMNPQPVHTDQPSENLVVENQISENLASENQAIPTPVSAHLTPVVTSASGNTVASNINISNHVPGNQGNVIHPAIPVSGHSVPVSHAHPVQPNHPTDHTLPSTGRSIEIRPIADGMYAMLDTSRGDLAVLSSSSANHYMVQSGHPQAVSVPVSVAVSTSAPTQMPVSGPTQVLTLPPQPQLLLSPPQHPQYTGSVGSSGETVNAWTHPFPMWQ